MDSGCLNIDTGSITDIEGVYAAGIHAGFKARALDLAYIFVPHAVASAGVFTRNACCSDTIRHTRRMVNRNTLKAMIINSGNANAGTGKQGRQAVSETVRLAAQYLGLKRSEVGVASTGVIGVQLPMDIMKNGLDRLLKSPKHQDGLNAAKAILTTDTAIKTVFLEKKIGKKTIQVAGICKGSGMIAPNMATMLAYLVTSVSVPQPFFQTALADAVDATFNCISVDSDMSTSDMVVGFATGKHRIAMTDRDQTSAFKDLLRAACEALAVQIVRDGEGATKLIELQVTGAATHADAKAIGLSVVNSPLVKTAIHGEDPNWGRILMAVGKTPHVKLNPNKIGVWMGEHCIVDGGEPTPFLRDDVRQSLTGKDVYIRIDLGLGKAAARLWGCDLSTGYIDINVDYS
jgi:glutamate N-acetyltransferase/amino-acid N-acetyltransferase